MYSQDDSQQADPKKLFLGNLPFSVTEEQLRELFAPHGELEEIVLVTDRMTHRSRGIAFVRFVNAEEASQAATKLNGFELEGRKMIVNVARPKLPRPAGFNRGGGRFRDNRRGFASSRFSANDRN